MERDDKVDQTGVASACHIGFHLVEGGDVEDGIGHRTIPSQGACRIEDEHLLPDHRDGISHETVAQRERAVECHVAHIVLAVVEVGRGLQFHLVGAVG